MNGCTHFDWQRLDAGQKNDNVIDRICIGNCDQELGCVHLLKVSLNQTTADDDAEQGHDCDKNR